MNTRIIRLLLCIPIALAFAVVLLLFARPLVTTALGSRDVITVNTTADEYDVVPNNTCSLREAIQTVNDGSNFGGCVRVVTSAPLDTILLPSGTYTLTRTGSPEDLNVTGDLDIRGSMIISATGATPPVVTEDSNLKERLLDIVEGTVTINGLTLTGGSESSQNGGGVRVAAGAGLLLNQVSLANNAAGSGGGVYSFGALTIMQSTFTHNTAALNDGGGVWAIGSAYVEESTFYSNTATSGYGGGLYNQGSLSITDSIVNENFAGQGGGGIQTYLGATALLNATVINNSVNSTGNWGGGGLLNNQGTLTVTNSTLSGNTAYFGGGIYNGGLAMLTNVILSGNSAGDFGGGIYNAFDGTATLINSTLSINLSKVSGGGIYNDYGGTATLSNSTLNRNSGAVGVGGGIANIGMVTLSNSTLRGNVAYGGGGIANIGMATLSNSTLNRNSAGTLGGGIYNYFSDTATLTNVTLSSNSANYGGGIFNYGTAMMSNITFYSNMALVEGGGIYLSRVTGSGSITLENSILAYSPSGGNCYGDPYGTSGATILSLGYNLSSDSSCLYNFNQATDLPPSTDPNLGPLGDHGGPTWTHLPLTPDSPGIDVIPKFTNGCGTTLTADQRGAPRPINGKCDIGAVEYGATFPWVYLPLAVR